MPLFHDPDYPRPQLRRAEWTNLNGPWEFALDPDAAWQTPAQVTWDRTIVVPFTPETPASGVGETGFFIACWYRRSFAAPTPGPGERLVLHFGAVDFAATVWVDGSLVGRHEGGYTPFAFDIGDVVRTSGLATAVEHEIVVRVEDDPADLAKPRGKQDWLLEPHAIWYPRTTGIWQCVWLERLPATAIASVAWTCSLDDWAIELQVALDGAVRDDLRLSVTLELGEQPDGCRILADDMYGVTGREVHRRIVLPDPGIDAARKALLWTPETPTLVLVRLRLLAPNGDVVDEVESYTALRAVGTMNGRFMLNGRPHYLRLVLDQGYWPESGLSAPDTAALRRDIEMTKAMGFNGVRKHQKIEDPRYLYWADVLGLFVWEEMPSAYTFSTVAVERLTREWTAAIARDRSHPCIIAWVPINESWGVPDLPTNSTHRAYVRALYHLTKTLDPSRPVIGNDGWEGQTSDIIAIHDYEGDPKFLVDRYADVEQIADRYWRDRVSGRLLTLDGHSPAGQPLMLTEFGGIAFVTPEQAEKTWGYTRAGTAEEFGARYAALLKVVNELKVMAGFCYTQFADTYQEANGLLFADRTPKAPLDEIALATRGPRTEREIERERRDAQERSRRAEHGAERAGMHIWG